MASVTERASRPNLLLLAARFRETGIVVVILLIVAAVSLRTPYFLTPDNFRDILLNIAILSIVALGQTMVILTRSIDLSVGSIIGLSAMVVGLAVRDNPDLPPVLALLMGIGLGMALGGINGLLVTLGRVPPIIATLGTLSVYRGLVLVVSKGQWVDAYRLPAGFVQMSKSEALGVPNLLLFAAAVAIGVAYFLGHTRLGREIYAIGSNPTAAQLAGIPVSQVLFLVFVLSGALAGGAGVLWASRFAAVANDTASGFELQTVAAAVVGGVNIFGGSGTVPGVLLGSLLLGIIANALTLVHISPFWQLAVQGLVILLAVVVDALISRRLQRALALRARRMAPA